MKAKLRVSAANPVQAAVGFDEADLKANRAGVLSERQRRGMKTKKVVVQIVIGCLSVPFIFLTLVGLLLLIRKTGEDLMSVVGMGWAVTGIVLAVCVYQYFSIRAETLHEPVHSYSGVVRRRKVLEGDDREEVFYVYFDDFQSGFKVDEHVYDAFANRALKSSHYTLYYLPGSKTILSAEPLENPSMPSTGSS